MTVINQIKIFSNPFKVQNRNLKNNNYNNQITFTGVNLAPLSKDTISFTSDFVQPTSNRQRIDESDLSKLARALGGIIKNEEQCQQVSEFAKTAERNLKRVLNKRLEQHIFSKDQNPHGQILPIQTRIKTPESIKEKTMDALANLIARDRDKFSAYDFQDIKNIIGDIVGARIVLRKSKTNETREIIDALIQAVNSGELKITKIENYVPKSIDPNLKYFDEADLKRLEDAVNQRRNSHEPIQVKTKTKETGYMALHIDVDLSNFNYSNGSNNYKGEIQILGFDVEKLKDVEDFCYKIKTGKNIKGGDKSYDAFVEYFNKYIADTDQYKNVRENFIEYTSRAYIYQRKKEPIHATKDPKRKEPYQLPTIEQCGMEGKIPPQLDFNVLARIKSKSDDLYNVIKDSKYLK